MLPNLIERKMISLPKSDYKIVNDRYYTEFMDIFPTLKLSIHDFYCFQLCIK